MIVCSKPITIAPISIMFSKFRNFFFWKQMAAYLRSWFHSWRFWLSRQEWCPWPRWRWACNLKNFTNKTIFGRNLNQNSKNSTFWCKFWKNILEPKEQKVVLKLVLQKAAIRSLSCIASSRRISGTLAILKFFQFRAKFWSRKRFSNHILIKIHDFAKYFCSTQARTTSYK